MTVASQYRPEQAWQHEKARPARPAPHRGAARPTAMAAVARRIPRVGVLSEVLLLGLLYVFYSGVRVLADTHAAAAIDRAATLLHLERLVGLDIEGFVNQLTAQTPWLGVGMSYWYASLHYLVTPAVMVWMFTRHRAAYPRVRNALIAASAIALIGYFLVPTAPPRLVPGEYIDVLAQSAQYGWWSDHASAPVGLAGLTNEFAALPSLHVGWAIWVAWAVASRTGRRAQVLAIAYAVGTTIVVVGTGNHWVLDAVAGALLMWFAIALTGALHRRRSAATT